MLDMIKSILADKRMMRVCARCGMRFYGALHGRYCTDACKKAAYRDRKKRGMAGNKSADLRTCARCGVQFEGALHARYCSDACKQAAYRERKDFTGQIHRKEKINPDVRWAVWERDNFTCQHCGSRRNLSVDHIHPESKGGKATLENCQTLCKSCNSRKGAR